MSEKQPPPNLNATDAAIPAFQGAAASHARAGGDLLWADFSDLSDERTETKLETVTTPFLSEHGSTLERHEGGWILRYSKQCQAIDSLRPKILELTLPIATDDKEGALFPRRGRVARSQGTRTRAATRGIVEVQLRTYE